MPDGVARAASVTIALVVAEPDATSASRSRPSFCSDSQNAQAAGKIDRPSTMSIAGADEAPALQRRRDARSLRRPAARTVAARGRAPAAGA